MRLMFARAVTVALAVLGGAGAMAFPKLIIGEAIPPKEPATFAAPPQPNSVPVIRVPRWIAGAPTPRRIPDERPRRAPRADAPQQIAVITPAPAPSRPAAAPAPAAAPPAPAPPAPTPEPTAPPAKPDAAPEPVPAPAPAPTPAPAVPTPAPAPTAPGPTTAATPPAAPVAPPAPVVTPPPFHHPTPAPLHPPPPPLHPTTVTGPVRTLSSVGHVESEPATDDGHGQPHEGEHDHDHHDQGADQHADQHTGEPHAAGDHAAGAGGVHNP